MGRSAGLSIWLLVGIGCGVLVVFTLIVLIARRQLKKAKKEMQSVQSVISDMTVLLDRLYKKFKPTDEAASKFPKGKLKSVNTNDKQGNLSSNSVVVVSLP